MKPRAIAVTLALTTLLFAPFEMVAQSALAEDWQQYDVPRAKIVVRPQESSRLDQTLSQYLLGPSAVRQEALYAQPCRRTQDVVTVPSSDAGTSDDVTVTSSVRGSGSRKVTITRC